MTTPWLRLDAAPVLTRACTRRGNEKNRLRAPRAHCIRTGYGSVLTRPAPRVVPPHVSVSPSWNQPRTRSATGRPLQGDRYIRFDGQTPIRFDGQIPDPCSLALASAANLQPLSSLHQVQISSDIMSFEPTGTTFLIPIKSVFAYRTLLS